LRRIAALYAIEASIRGLSPEARREARQRRSKPILDAFAPWLFRVGATCADAAQSTLLGQPYEVWSGAWFAIVALAALWLMAVALRPSGR